MINFLLQSFSNTEEHKVIEEKLQDYLSSKNNVFSESWFNKFSGKSKDELIASYKDKLEKKLMTLLTEVLEKEVQKYKKVDNLHSRFSDSEEIYTSAANSSAIISFGLSLIPPPFSFLTIVPELAGVVKDQIKMISQMANFMGHKEMLSKDVVMSLFVAKLSNEGKQLVTKNGSQYVIGQLQKNITEKVCGHVANKLIQQIGGSLVTKFVPGLGSAFLAVWIRHQTMTMGKKAVEVYANKFVVEPIEDGWDFLVENTIQKVDADKETKANLEKVKLFVNLMNADNRKDRRELNYIFDLLTNIEMTPPQRANFCVALASKEVLDVDFDLIIEQGNTTTLMLDLIAFMNIDNDKNIKEIEYINEVSEKLGKSSVLSSFDMAV